MKYLILIFVSSIIFIQCSYKSILPKETQTLIPPNANKIVLFSELPSDSLFDFAVNFLTANNFRIFSYDKGFGYINTDGKYIGNWTMMRMNILIVKNDKVSKLISTGDWIVGANLSESSQQVWKPASKGERDLSDYAYDNMVLILQKFPNKEIHFVQE